MAHGCDEIQLAAASNSRFFVSVRSWFSWLLMFGVIAGLCGRVLALDHSHRPGEATECCGHDHDHGSSDKDTHDQDGLPGTNDHHVHACCHPAPLVGEEIESHRLPAPSQSLLGVTGWTTLPPESPVFELDKPPLI